MPLPIYTIVSTTMLLKVNMLARKGFLFGDASSLLVKHEGSTWSDIQGVVEPQFEWLNTASSYPSWKTQLFWAFHQKSHIDNYQCSYTTLINTLLVAFHSLKQ